MGELQSFPFDVQPLHVKLHVEQEEAVEMEMKNKDSVGEDLSERLRKKWGNTEWCFLDLQARSAHKAKSIGSRGNVARLFVSCRVQRHARSYLIRIIGVILMICILTVCIFVIDPMDDLPDMVGHSFMMLLTLTTYSLVVGDILPNLGYLTVLDHTVLVCFAFLACIVMQVVYLGQESKEEDVDVEALDSLSKTFAIGDLIGIVVIAVLYWLYINIVVVRKNCARSMEIPRRSSTM